MERLLWLAKPFFGHGAWLQLRHSFVVLQDLTLCCCSCRRAWLSSCLCLVLCLVDGHWKSRGCPIPGGALSRLSCVAVIPQQGLELGHL